MFDVAGSLLLIDVDRSGEIGRQNIALSEDTPWKRAKYFENTLAEISKRIKDMEAEQSGG